jgi:hypothetical protein
MSKLNYLEEQAKRIMLDILVPLRTEKKLNRPAIESLCNLIQEFGEATAHDDLIPKFFMVCFFDVFTSMLAEAEHAPDPKPIRDAAWEIEERLSSVFELFEG